VDFGAHDGTLRLELERRERHQGLSLRRMVTAVPALPA
jgi:hypothetical protein